MGYCKHEKLGALRRWRKRTAARRWRKRKEARGHKHEEDLSVVSLTDQHEPRKKLRKSEEESNQEESFRKNMADGFDVLKPFWGVNGWPRISLFNGKDCPLVVNLYAKFGLHLYNLSHGTNLQLRRVEKYNRYGMPRPATYFITLVAEYPDTASLIIFQTRVEERSHSSLDVMCNIARPKNPDIKGSDSYYITGPEFYDVEAPEWPLKNPSADENRFFYKVPKSKWKKYDWIRLYMEIAFVTKNRSIHNRGLSAMKISSVLFETEDNVEPLEVSLKCFQNANVYIRYDQHLGEDRICKRVAVIRRAVDWRTKRLCLIGENLDVPDSE